jgi:hypothetical protein
MAKPRDRDQKVVTAATRYRSAIVARKKWFGDHFGEGRYADSDKHDAEKDGGPVHGWSFRTRQRAPIIAPGF